MDEPTNHLDVASKEALEHALMHYDGTLILISHDRYFLDKIVSRVIELKDRQMTEYAGNYSYYLQKRDAEPEFVSHVKGKPKVISDAKKTKEQKRLEAKARQTISKERKRLRKTVNSVERQVEKCEARKEKLEFEMALPETYEDSGKVVVLQKEYANLKKELEDLYRQWEEAQLELEELVSQLA
jgi:ATP-binding cassette subfamily F protein 3